MGIFIGRRAALEALLADLTGPSDRTIADIHGIGGMGKTTLKTEVLLRLEAAGARIPFFEADENAPRENMADFLVALSDSLRQPWDGPKAAFGRLKRHRERLRDLKAKLPQEALVGDGLRTTVATLTRDHEERELLLEPLAVLTRDFFDDLADYLCPEAPGLGGLLAGKREMPADPLRVIVAIDSFEALELRVQDWLLAHLLPEYDRHRFEGRPLTEVLDLRLLLCGRHALRDADPLRRWDVLADRIREIDLDRFDEREIGTYLQARDLSPDLAPAAADQTQGLPYLLALWCDSAGQDRVLAVGRAARRMFWWKSPQQIRWLKAAAHLDTVDRDGLAIALADSSQDEAFAWLAPNGELCRSDGTALIIHPIVRRLVCEGVAQESPSESAELSRRGLLAARIARFRRQHGEPVFDRLLDLAPLRWFDRDILRELMPADATELSALANRFADPASSPERRTLESELREDLLAYLKLAEPARLHDAHARIEALEARRRQEDREHRQRSRAQTETLARDAAVARKRALALESRMLALQAQEKSALEALKRAQAEEAALDTASAPVARMLRALGIGRASAADRAALRKELDAASTRVADLKTDLSQVLIEASEAAREADELEARTAAASAVLEHPFEEIL